MDMEASFLPPPVPPKAYSYVSVFGPPTWVMPMTFTICNEHVPHSEDNGVGIDADGDLLLYRKITEQDVARYPSLVGMHEIWISMRLSASD